jgi:two-component system copper resistance phosphate regulon response regulator CusR
LALAKEGSYDALVLDVMLPGLDGFTLASELRTSNIETPIVFLTAKDALPDRIRGLEVGGGDYLVKPFAFSELLLRLNNLLHRGNEHTGNDRLIGDLSINPLQRRVYRAGKRLDLSNQEFALLDLLARNVGNIVTRDRIAEELWEMAAYGDPNLVDAAVRRVRKKVDDPFPGKLIHTRRGVGYVLELSGD